ncbi:MAG: MATE family efflux transporter [Eubacteriales bacterium]|nr:MATE family efflux transporter [Eubacteriales bacterium]
MSLKKKLFRYMLPSVAAMWVFSLYTMVDGLFVSWGVGTDALAAVNLSMPFINLTFAVALLFAAGASTVVSAALGRGDKAEANRLFSMEIVSVCVVSAVMTSAALLNLDHVARFLGATEHSLPMVRQYLSIIISFNCCFLISYSLEVLVKTDGFPLLATVSVCTGAVTNIALDWLFVMVLDWGIAGAAWATGLSQLFSGLLLLSHFLRKRGALRFVRFRFRIREIGRMTLIGVADSLTELSSGVIVFLFNRAILAVVGEWAIASYTVITYANTLVMMTMVGITQGMQPLVSFHRGRGEQSACRSLYGLAGRCVAAAAAAAFLLAQLGAPVLMGIFIPAEQGTLIEYGVHALRIFSLSFLMVGFNILTSGYLAAMERPGSAMTISVARGFVLITAVLYVLPALLGSDGIWFSAGACEALCLAVAMVLLRQERKRSARMAVESSAA